MSLKYSITFCVLSVVFAYGSIAARDSIGAASYALIWPAIAFGVMSAAYGGLGPRVFQKRATGKARPLAKLALAPYRLLNDLSFLLFRHSGKESQYIRLSNNLYLGRRLTAREACQAIDAEKWIGALDLACEFDEVEPLRTLSRYRSFPVLDATAPTAEELRAVVDWTIETMREGPVYVHCALGHGRSAMVILAVLLVEGSAHTVDEGLALLRALRPGIALNTSQRQAAERIVTEKTCRHY